MKRIIKKFNLGLVSTIVALTPTMVLCSCKETKWFEKADWWNYTDQAQFTDVGTICKVSVNGVEHQVRLIGIEQDYDAEGKLIHTTWEFANTICDENGNSLATLWNDCLYEDHLFSNIDYINSTIRKSLTGEGNGTGAWYQKKQATRSEKYTGKTVLDMIDNQSFKNKLKVVSKQVAIGELYEQEKKELRWYTEEMFTDKLFLLSAAEIGSISAKSSAETQPAYQYYANSPFNPKSRRYIDKKRVKTQVGEKESFPLTRITDSLCAEQIDVWNYSGLCSQDEHTQFYWLRSPCISPIMKDESYVDVFSCNYEGMVAEGVTIEAHANAISVAPCFCI